MSDQPDEEERIAAMAIDPLRLLPGERSGSHRRTDAAHWVDVYTELRQTKMSLISGLESMIRIQSRAAREELEISDLRLLRLQFGRFEARLEFWRGRLAQLDAKERSAG